MTKLNRKNWNTKTNKVWQDRLLDTMQRKKIPVHLKKAKSKMEEKTAFAQLQIFCKMVQLFNTISKKIWSVKSTPGILGIRRSSPSYPVTDQFPSGLSRTDISDWCLAARSICQTEVRSFGLKTNPPSPLPVGMEQLNWYHDFFLILILSSVLYV